MRNFPSLPLLIVDVYRVCADSSSLLFFGVLFWENFGREGRAVTSALLFSLLSDRAKISLREANFGDIYNFLKFASNKIKPEEKKMIF